MLAKGEALGWGKELYWGRVSCWFWGVSIFLNPTFAKLFAVLVNGLGAYDVVLV